MTAIQMTRAHIEHVLARLQGISAQLHRERVQYGFDSGRVRPTSAAMIANSATVHTLFGDFAYLARHYRDYPQVLRLAGTSDTPGLPQLRTLFCAGYALGMARELAREPSTWCDDAPTHMHAQALAPRLLKHLPRWDTTSSETRQLATNCLTSIADHPEVHLYHRAELWSQLLSRGPSMRLMQEVELNVTQDMAMHCHFPMEFPRVQRAYVSAMTTPDRHGHTVLTQLPILMCLNEVQCKQFLR